MSKRRLPEGTILGFVDCPSCGRELPLKENKAGGVYYFCAATLSHDENGKVTDKCMTRFNFGRAGSAKIINEYLQQKGELNADKPQDEREPAGGEPEFGIGHNGGPALDDEPAGDSGSFGSALKHFLTGDE